MRRILFGALLSPILIIGGLWGALALWYQGPGHDALRWALVAGWSALFAAGAVLVFTRERWRALAVAALSFGLLTVWWSTILPSNTRDWAPDVARTVTGEIIGNELRLHNVRNFLWRDENSADERWEERGYDLSKLVSADLYAVYWMGEDIAHTIVSFGFSDGRELAWSIELRRRKGDSFSAIAGFFKQAELVFIAADERDVIALRTNVRQGEEVRLYPLHLSKEALRKLLEEYVTEANALAASPRWYNTATANCTTGILQLARLVNAAIPVDWRVLASGHFPEFVYDHGGLGSRHSFAELRALAPINDLAQRADLSDEVAFSRAIRARHALPD